MKISKQTAWLLHELWVHRVEFSAALFCIAASAALYLLLPHWTAELVETILPSGRIALLVRHLAFGLCIYVLATMLTSGRAYLMTRLSQRIAMATRERIFRHILRVSPRLLQSMGGGNLLSTVSNDLGFFQSSVTSIVGNMVPAAILVLCFSIAMAWNSWMLFCTSLLFISPLVLATSAFGKKVYAAVHRSQDGLAKVFTRFEESIGGVKEIKSFTREPAEIERFTGLSEEALEALLYRDRLESLQPLMIAVSAALAISVLILASAIMVNNKLITLDALTAFLVCALLVYVPLQDACRSATRLVQLRAVMERIDRVLTLPPELDGPLALPAKHLKGKVKFDKVCFAYESSGFRFNDFNLEVEAGQMIAIVGASGAGKSSLLDFIPRFLTPQSGRVLIDDIDIASLRLSDLRREIGIVAQEPVLFQATIEENLRFGAPDATDEDVLAASRAAHVDEFVQRMPGGYGALIEWRGRNLSVGQRQRIAIARVFLKNPTILLLDEPSSALDAGSERLVRDAVKSATVGRTTFVVAHRMSTVREADRILVIDQGRIVEDGTHADLIGLRGAYYTLYTTQFGGGKDAWAPQAA